MYIYSKVPAQTTNHCTGVIVETSEVKCFQISTIVMLGSRIWKMSEITGMLEYSAYRY